jgi:hypothetical protein
MSAKLSAHQMTLLRWVAILPGAMLGGVTAFFPLHWLLGSLFPHGGEYFLDFIMFQKPLDVESIELTLTPFVFSVFSIWAGAEIAPKFKLAIAFALSGMWLVVGAYLFWSSGGHDIIELKTVGGVAGLVVGPFIVWLRTKLPRSVVVS